MRHTLSTLAVALLLGTIDSSTYAIQLNYHMKMDQLSSPQAVSLAQVDSQAVTSKRAKQVDSDIPELGFLAGPPPAASKDTAKTAKASSIQKALAKGSSDGAPPELAKAAAGADKGGEKPIEKAKESEGIPELGLDGVPGGATKASDKKSKAADDATPAELGKTAAGGDKGGDKKEDKKDEKEPESKPAKDEKAADAVLTKEKASKDGQEYIPELGLLGGPGGDKKAKSGEGKGDAKDAPAKEGADAASGDGSKKGDGKADKKEDSKDGAADAKKDGEAEAKKDGDKDASKDKKEGAEKGKKDGGDEKKEGGDEGKKDAKEEKKEGEEAKKDDKDTNKEGEEGKKEEAKDAKKEDKKEGDDAKKEGGEEGKADSTDGASKDAKDDKGSKGEKESGDSKDKAAQPQDTDAEPQQEEKKFGGKMVCDNYRDRSKTPYCHLAKPYTGDTRAFNSNLAVPQAIGVARKPPTLPGSVVDETEKKAPAEKPAKEADKPEKSSESEEKKDTDDKAVKADDKAAAKEDKAAAKTEEKAAKTEEKAVPVELQVDKKPKQDAKEPSEKSEEPAKKEAKEAAPAEKAAKKSEKAKVQSEADKAEKRMNSVAADEALVQEEVSQEMAEEEIRSMGFGAI